MTKFSKKFIKKNVASIKGDPNFSSKSFICVISGPSWKMMLLPSLVHAEHAKPTIIESVLLQLITNLIYPMEFSHLHLRSHLSYQPTFPRSHINPSCNRTIHQVRRDNGSKESHWSYCGQLHLRQCHFAIFAFPNAYSPTTDSLC